MRDMPQQGWSSRCYGFYVYLCQWKDWIAARVLPHGAHVEFIVHTMLTEFCVTRPQQTILSWYKDNNKVSFAKEMKTWKNGSQQQHSICQRAHSGSYRMLVFEFALWGHVHALC